MNLSKCYIDKDTNQLYTNKTELLESITEVLTTRIEDNPLIINNREIDSDLLAEWIANNKWFIIEYFDNIKYADEIDSF